MPRLRSPLYRQLLFGLFNLAVYMLLAADSKWLVHFGRDDSQLTCCLKRSSEILISINYRRNW
jgi:hypothetical protein